MRAINENHNIVWSLVCSWRLAYYTQQTALELLASSLHSHPVAAQEAT
jgi:hypothetical protein